MCQHISVSTQQIKVCSQLCIIAVCSKSEPLSSIKIQVFTNRSSIIKFNIIDEICVTLIRYHNMKNLLFAFITITLFGCYSKNKEHAATVSKKPVYLSAEIYSLMQNLDYQTQQTKSYDPSYIQLDYPNGDVNIQTGVCADVIVRAFRANKIDLQKEIHEDMSRHFSVYPDKWNLSKPDKNIDHRRVPNIMTFFERKQKAVSLTNMAADYLPGDVIAWMLPNNLYHIGIVSDEKDELGVPVIIHNIGSGTKKANVLFAWKIIGHYRWFQ